MGRHEAVKSLFWPAVLRRYMFKYDSTHGKYHGDVVGGSEGLFINGKKIASYSKMCAHCCSLHSLAGLHAPTLY